MDLALSPNAAKAIDDLLGVAGGRDWLAGVPDRLDDLARRWGVRPTDNLHAGTSGLIFRARCDDPSSGEVALKLSFDEPELDAEHLALRAAEKLSVAPLAREYRYETGALATFWISGRPAAHDLDPAALQATLDAIHVDVPVDAQLRELATYTQDALDRALARLPEAAGCGIATAHVERARSLAAELAGGGHRAFLHGDVHPTNVISTDQGLVLCDAKGLVGDPAYDAAIWALKADKLMTRHAWLDFFGARYGHGRVAGWAAVVGTCHAVSYAVHGKRRDRIDAYAAIALERLG